MNNTKITKKTKITKNTKKILKNPFFLVIFVFLVIVVLFTYLPSKITYEISNFAIFGFFGFYGFYGFYGFCGFFLAYVVQHYWGSFPFFPSCLRLRAEGGGGLSPKGSPRSSTKADNSCFCLSLSLGGGSFPSCLSFLSLLPKPELDRGLMEGGASFPSGLFFPSCLSLSLT